MIQIVAGPKGRGKTKLLLDKVNASVNNVPGSIVYLDKSAKHMYELDKKVRLIDVSEFELATPEHFIGFIYGILSQDHDLHAIYFDSFIKISKTTLDTLVDVIKVFENISKKYNIDFVISLSLEDDEVPEYLKQYIIN
ncbi:MAG: twitching motility protein PilT [Lachnospiraceae bacterium]|nr:twitching motility protein PilT [Lachnospiraceae bacterium]